MVILSKKALREFAHRHPLAYEGLKRWYDEVKKADWRCFADMRQTFGSADGVGRGRFVFNVGGNRYRVVAMVNFAVRTVYVLFVGTHEEYDRWNVLQDFSKN